MRKPTSSRILPCPFCGRRPAYDKPNQVVHCENLECALSDFYINTEEWNRRALNKKVLIKYLFDVHTVYKGADFVEADEYVCKCCGGAATSPYKVKHKKNCEIKALISVL